MAISEKDLKILWARAAGRCSAPNCRVDLTPRLSRSGNTILGEMAHIIGRKPRAARSASIVGADDSYGNLILLCPTHHTLIDKAPEDFPVDLLESWKREWELEVSRNLVRTVSVRGAQPMEMRLWTYFNFDLILRLHEQLATICDFAPMDLVQAGMIDEHGLARPGRETREGDTIFDTWGGEQRRLQRHFSDLVEKLFEQAPPIDLDAIWGIRKLDGFLYPGAVAFTNRRCAFSDVPGETPEVRRVKCWGHGIRLVFQIQRSNIFSRSSVNLHFKGNSRVAALLWIRSVEREGNRGKQILVIKATPIALGTGFWLEHDRTPNRFQPWNMEEE